jgi:hypothetical protein
VIEKRLDIASSYRKVLFEKRYASRRCFVGHAGSPVQAGVPRNSSRQGAFRCR